MAALAAAQFGVISLAQLRALGLSERGVRNAVAAGRLHRVHRGVYAVGRADLTSEGHWMAAILTCGEGAVLSYVTAAAHFGIRPSAASQIDVTIPRAAPVSRRKLRVHRHPDLTSADVTTHEGLPVTNVSRTLLDLASILRRSEVARACDQAAILRLYDQREMDDVLLRSRGRKGVRLLRQVLAEGDLGENVPMSPLEEGFLSLVLEAGLPKPGINRWLRLGDHYLRVDFIWYEDRLVVETDGARYHSTGFARLRDQERDCLLDNYGWNHARFDWNDVFGHPSRTVNEVRRLRRQRSPDRRVMDCGP